jgi:sterol desaturase/sphingolipid hydroxylase (fatty acid hydroxylase superfamily)
METVTETLLAYKSVIVAGWVILFFIMERLRPAAIVPLDAKGKAGRLFSNGGLFGTNVILSIFIIVPISVWATATGPDWRSAYAPWWDGIGGLLADLLILDMLIYFWHRANHQFPLLWRFHEVHHLDATLDSTTAFRFHWGEVLLSALARAVIVISLDIPLESVLVFETQVLLAAIFAHSNVKLSPGLEKALGWIVITPAIHWIHHHAIRRDTDSNYGNLFSFWDRLFRTFNKTPRSPTMSIGVEREPEKPFLRLFMRPFESRS